MRPIIEFVDCAGFDVPGVRGGGLLLASEVSGSSGEPAADPPTPNAGKSHEITLREVSASVAPEFQQVDERLPLRVGDDTGPFIHLYPSDQFVGAILRSKYRSLAVFHVLPIFAKRRDEIRLVRN